MVIEAQSSMGELLAKNAVLLAKVVNGLQLAPIHPPGNGDQQKPVWVEYSLGLASSLSTALLIGDPRRPRRKKSQWALREMR
jgi:hypothetical protein